MGDSKLHGFGFLGIALQWIMVDLILLSLTCRCSVSGGNGGYIFSVLNMLVWGHQWGAVERTLSMLSLLAHGTGGTCLETSVTDSHFSEWLSGLRARGGSDRMTGSPCEIPQVITLDRVGVGWGKEVHCFCLCPGVHGSAASANVVCGWVGVCCCVRGCWLEMWGMGHWTTESTTEGQIRCLFLNYLRCNQDFCAEDKVGAASMRLLVWVVLHVCADVRCECPPTTCQVI